MDGPCSICGNNDMKLVDGFYYCVECGTQDTTVRETIVEQTVLADGTLQVGTIRKIHKDVNHDDVLMSGEWYKWHAFNFILLGLVDELILLGAKPSLKMKTLWVWTRYIRKFQNKKDLGIISSTFIHHKEIGDSIINSDSYSSSNSMDVKSKRPKKRVKTSYCNIKKITVNLLLSILYVALNLDKSDIQFSHLNHFITEDKLSLFSWAKFLPGDINIKKIPDWNRFELLLFNKAKRKRIHQISINLMKELKLGAPVLPNLNNIVDNFVRELCLPSDFKYFVLSLMNLMPIDFLNLSSKDTKNMIRIPDYEITVMAYVLLALKMCFGLDDEYELKLSDAVDHVNESEDIYLKSYKLGMYSSSSDRLFSFRDWTKYLQLRKHILSRYYLPFSYQNNKEADDYVLVDQFSRTKRKGKIRHDITMDILNKLPLLEEGIVIPKSEFPATLTPMTTYTEVIIQYLQDPELKLILSEDFSQYSLKYAITDLCFPNKYKNLLDVVVGVNDNYKIKNKYIIGNLEAIKADLTEVYVRNCENKNWLKTNPPAVKHVRDEKNESDSESDHSYESAKDATISRVVETDDQSNKNEFDADDKDVKFEFITEEEESRCIFDDTFENIKEEKTTVLDVDQNALHNELYETFTNDDNLVNDVDESQDSKSEIYSCSTIKRQFDPNNFNRASTIKELIIKACKDLKVPVPKEYRETAPVVVRRKRQADTQITDGAAEPRTKRTRINTKQNDAKLEVDNILKSYYSRAENNLLNQISLQLANTIQNDQFNLNNEDFPADMANQSVGDISAIINNSPLDSNVETNICNADTSIVENSEAEVEIIVKEDPRYDEKTHSIKQLYVKMPGNQETDEIDPQILADDVDLQRIIDTQIDKINQDNIEKTKPDIRIIDTSESDSDYDIPLKVLQENMKKGLQNLEKRKKNLESLVKRKSDFQYNYWLRHYSTNSFNKCQEMKAKFDKELLDNFPRSFAFVIKECGSIANCDRFALYRMLQSLEKTLLSKMLE